MPEVKIIDETKTFECGSLKVIQQSGLPAMSGERIIKIHVIDKRPKPREEFYEWRGTLAEFKNYVDNCIAVLVALDGPDYR